MIINQINAVFESLGIANLLSNQDITEIVINEPNVIYYEEQSVWKCLEVENNQSNQKIEGLGLLLINYLGQNQKFDRDNPMLSLTMPNGERAQLVRSPAVEHSSLTIRIPSKKRFTMSEYDDKGIFKEIIPVSKELSSKDQELKNLLEQRAYRDFLEKAVLYQKNIIVSGATGSGKTTFMKTLLDLIPQTERIITIEDAREIFIDHPNKVHLMYPKNTGNEAKITAKSCLEATLRMKPDRIILAEVRGDEAFYFIRACGNGHTGSMTSLHADSALMAYEQLALMISASPEGVSLSHEVIKRLILMTIDISIHFANSHGKRYITGIDFNPERKIRLLNGD